MHKMYTDLGISFFVVEVTPYAIESISFRCMSLASMVVLPANAVE